MIHVEGNNGGDYLKVEDMGGGDVYLEVGHCCVVAHRGVFPVEILTAALAKVGVFNGLDLPWDHETSEHYRSRVRLLDMFDPLPRRKPPRVHNRVTKAQLALKPGDQVEVTFDTGKKRVYSVKHEPTKVGGTWVTWLHEMSGCYALCRCKPLKVKPA